EQRIGRVIDGYDRVVEALVEPVRGRLRLDSIVTLVKWRRGRVEVHSRSAGGHVHPPILARAAVIAVPLAILRSQPRGVGHIVFDPPISKARAAAGMEMGGVLRIALQVDRPFWMESRFAALEGDARLDAMSFLQGSPRLSFPVWWTNYPLRAP